MTSITTTPVGIDARDESAPTLAQRALNGFSALWAKYQQYRKERRLRDTLADLSDAELLDIGIADHEIARVRSFDRFTPQAWCDPEGRVRHV
jgi:uncharacterized protein YjiS (DUF1127 family)